MLMEKIFYLVTYDIEKNRSRTKIAKLLEGYGERVQKSVFEIRVKKQTFRKLKAKAETFLDEGDSIRWYQLCAKCHDHILISGTGMVYEPQDTWIV